MIVSRHIGGGAPYTDPARLVAQVVTAIGFIGAGVILQSRGSITGLTTAATILVVGAVGVTVGEGMFTVAVMTTVLIIVVLVVLRKIESAFIRRRRLFRYQLKTTDISDSITLLHGLLENEGLRLDDFSVLDLSDGRHELRFGVVTSLETNNRLIKLLPEIGTEVQGATGTAPD
jgi:putative Mg2+ transporter-C (MgtC) family protein